MLIEAGADPNARDPDQPRSETPLHWAASSDDVDVARALIDGGADVDAPVRFPVAGPPCFLDDDLFEFKDLDDDPANIFPNQPTFMAEMAREGLAGGVLLVPGTVATITRDGCEIE